jgi:hypothetical protein
MNDNTDNANIPEDFDSDFDLEVTSGSVQSSGASVSNESEDKRLARLAAYFRLPGKLYSVGNLLATVVNGKTLAAHIEADNTYSKVLRTVTINGTRYPLRDGFAIGLATCRTPTKADGTPSDTPHWGCLACGSAHGSAIYPSKGRAKAKGLVTNQFYYSESSRDMFCISDTCWKTYIKEDASRRKRFAVAPKTAKASA